MGGGSGRDSPLRSGVDLLTPVIGDDEETADALGDGVMDDEGEVESLGTGGGRFVYERADGSRGD